ncbi:DUF4097 family beta strand repeat-containing protein [Bowmanella yangjiangensis]|uniref:DUF4097 family beta strand repeat protein n=1 Tax=Bowmanella yangjiangensis TaxID=2811230 RepID=A0ABS3CXV9_9ALTE|nr:DUF4097 family beta strand repeat-containing protein [Bowmanella yangjiangensis]MBN7821957.1 DUF4097 family beta strand repeat protein [Bowmanella yangjiangensis]
MNRFLIAAGMSLVSHLCLAGEKVDLTLDAKADGRVSIEHLSGQAVIKGWDKKQVKVVGELSDQADKLIFERDGHEVVVKVKMPNGNWHDWKNSEGDDLQIFVPTGSLVSYDTVNANVEAEKLSGGAELSSVNGKVKVRDIKGRIRIETVNGSIESSGLQGDIKLSSVNGHIVDKNSQGDEIRYESVNGDIDASTSAPRVKIENVTSEVKLALGKVERLSVQTVSGDANISLTLLEDGEVSGSTVSGDLELVFQDKVSARFDLEGHAGGHFANHLSSDKMEKAKYGPSRWLKFRTGESSAKVRISTVSGRISLDSK